MFEENYKNDNENIVPDESVKKYIKSKLVSPETKAKPKFRYAPVLASVLCFALAVGLIFVPGKDSFVPSYVGDTALMQNMSYDAIYDKVSECLDRQNNYYEIEDGIGYLNGYMAKGEAVVMEPGAAADDLGTTGTDVNNSSTTNNQVQGVDESDLVKNDGR